MLDDERQRELMRRHDQRHDVLWVPYAQRISDGALIIQETDQAKVTVTMAVAGLGNLVISVYAQYNPKSGKIHWDETAIIRVAICEIPH